MQEIVKRLKEQREIELAKSIMEANGYTVGKRSSAYMQWSEWGDILGDGRHCTVYSRVGTSLDAQEYIGVVYAPGTYYDDNGDEFEYYPMILRPDQDYSEVEVLDDDFSTEKEAKAWIEERFSYLTSKPEESPKKYSLIFLSSEELSSVDFSSRLREIFSELEGVVSVNKITKTKYKYSISLECLPSRLQAVKTQIEGQPFFESWVKEPK